MIYKEPSNGTLKNMWVLETFLSFSDLEILSASIVYVSVKVLFIVQLVCSATVNSNDI